MKIKNKNTDAQKIKIYRVLNKLTQKQLSERFLKWGITQRNIQCWEQGISTKSPLMKVLLKLISNKDN